MIDTPEGKAALRDALPYVEQAIAKLKVAFVVEIEAIDWTGPDRLVEPNVKKLLEKIDWVTATLEGWAK